MRALHVTALLLSSGSAFATERSLAYTLAGPTVEAGAHEVLLSVTPRFGRPEPFLRIENLVGFAYGFSAKVEAQLLLSVALESAAGDSRSIEGAIATRWRWQLLNGRADVVGLGLTGTAAVSVDSVFLEARAGAEKWLGDFLFALNASADFTVRRDGGAGPQTHLEQSGGIVYQLSNGFSSGFEVRNRLGFERGEYYGDAVFCGPVFGVRSKSFWLMLAALPQVAAVKAPKLYGNGQALELRDNERWLVRVQLGLEVP